MRKVKWLAIISLVFILDSCEDELLNEEFRNTPTGNFDALWSEYDRTYGAFEAKHIQWDSLYHVYRNQINDQSSEEQLHTAMIGLLGELNDGHVQLTASRFQRFFSIGMKTIYPDSKYYENSKQINALFSLLQNKYLYSVKRSGSFFCAQIRSFYTSKTIGYIYIPTFVSNGFPTDFVNEALDSFIHADGLIIDVRFNGGGATETFLRMLNKLTDRKRLYLKSKLRNGSSHNNYTQLYSHYVEPKYGAFSKKPLMLLVNRFSASSSEHFMLALQTYEYATVVGDTTYGALSVVLEKVLPNGWAFRTCPQVLCDTLGNFLLDSRGRYPDGFGLAPDVYVVNYYRDIINGRDFVAESAISLINRMKK